MRDSSQLVTKRWSLSWNQKSYFFPPGSFEPDNEQRDPANHPCGKIGIVVRVSVLDLDNTVLFRIGIRKIDRGNSRVKRSLSTLRFQAPNLSSSRLLGANTKQC